MSLSERLLMYAQQFEDQHAPENITLALREASSAIEGLMKTHDEMADEIDALIEQLGDQTAEVLNLKADIEGHTIIANNYMRDNERLMGEVRKHNDAMLAMAQSMAIQVETIEELREAMLDVVAVVGLQGTDCGERILKIARAVLGDE